MSKIKNRLRLEILGSVAWLLICATACTPEPLSNTARPSEGTAPVTPIPLSATSEVTVQPAVSPTQNPIATPDATEIDATLRADYAAYATERAKVGASVVPYETEAYYRTAAVVDMTRQADLLLTPTPFGPLPFPGTRLTDEELAERGWSRIESDGRRNTDYHATAIWLDKAYVDAEIFSQYQALFELLAFRDGPPGDDFEARLRELMLPSEPEGSGLDGLVAESYRDGDLVSCTYSAVTESVLSLRDAGAYVRVPDDLLGYSMIWQYVEDQPAPIGAYTDKAITFNVNEYFIVFLRVVLQHPERPETFEGLNLNFQTVAIQTGKVMQEWVSTYNVTTANESFVAVWSPETGNWRLLKYESPYCSDYYPASIRK